MRRIVSAVSFAMVCAQPSVWADAFGLQSAGQAESYGINYSSQPEATDAALTPTSHHRLGQSTGIGSSTLQTEANTAEAMSRVQYTPTANPPQMGVPMPAVHTGMPRLHTFSERMLAVPTPTPSISAIPNLEQAMSPGMRSLNQSNFGVRGPASLSPSLTEPIWQPHARPGARFGTQIDNPFQGL